MRRGYYKLLFNFNDNSRLQRKKVVTFAVINERKDNEFPEDEDFAFGIQAPGVGKTWQLRKDIGVGWCRDYISWSELEKNRGHIDWSIQDSVFDSAEKYEMRMLPCLGFLPRWASAAPPNSSSPRMYPPLDFNEYSKYVFSVVDRYKDRCGGIKYWEVWNEIYLKCGFKGTIEDCVEIHKATCTAAKKADPQCKIMGNLTDGYPYHNAYLEQFLKLGGWKYLDAVSLHAYPTPKDASPEDADFAGSIDRVRALIDKYVGNKKEIEIWCTEQGWLANDYFNPTQPYGESSLIPFKISERSQANYMVRLFVIAFSKGVRGLMYFKQGASSTIGRPNPFDITRYGCSPKPGFVAYATMTDKLDGAKFRKEINLGGTVKAYLFRRGQNYTAVLWNTEKDNSATIRLKVSPKQLSIVDIMGNIEKIQKKREGIVFQIDGSPRFLEWGKGVSEDKIVSVFQSARIMGLPFPEKVKITLKDLSKVIVEITNTTNTPKRGNIGVVPPDSWKLHQSQRQYGPIGPGKTEKLSFPIDKFKTVDSCMFIVKLSNGMETSKNFNFIWAKKLQEKIKIDGLLDEEDWNKTVVCELKTLEQAWSTSTWKNKSPDWEGPSDLSAKVYLLWDENSLYLGVNAKDDKLIKINSKAPKDASGFGRLGDNIQLAFDTLNNSVGVGFDRDDYLYGLSLLPDGEENYNWWYGPEGKGIGQVSNIDLKIQTNGDQVVYEAKIPFARLKPFTPKPNKIMGFNLIINDDDGKGRKGWIGISGGIGEIQSPGLFHNLVLQGF